VNLTDLHRRLLADVHAVGGVYPLVLRAATQSSTRPGQPASQDLDVATENPEPTDKIAATLRAGLEELGWHVQALEADPLSARLIVTDPATGEECEVDVLKEALWHPPVKTEHGLVLSLEDVVGTKIRALADQGLARDLVDIRAAADRWSHAELEELGRRHARDTFDLTDFQARLAGADWIDDTEFAAYGLGDHQITDLRRWAQA
jgi:hypothetical protein